MTSIWLPRSIAGVLFAACVGLAALPGCGGSAPPKADKKEEPAPNPNPGPNPKPGTPPENPPKSTLGPVEPAAAKAQTEFLRALIDGKATAAMLSPSFVKAVGKAPFPEDNATSWLRTVGEGLTVGAELNQKQAGDVVFFHGTLGGARFAMEPGKTGSYSLRLVRAGGDWKVDWLSLSSAEVAGTPPQAPSAEAAAQEFAATSFVELIADRVGMPGDTRAPLVAAAMTPALRAAWGPPFDSDRSAGLDYNPGKLDRKAKDVAGGTSKFSVSRSGEAEYRAELTRPAGTKALVVKLTKGAAPHAWLVSEVGEPKG